MQTINLSGFNYSGTDVLDRLTRVFQPLIEQTRHDTQWFQTEVILPAMAQGVEINQITRGVARYAQLVGIPVQGVEGLRAA